MNLFKLLVYQRAGILDENFNPTALPICPKAEIIEAHMKHTKQKLEENFDSRIFLVKHTT